MIDIGVARPGAHGHAMMSTEVAVASANAIAGGGPYADHARKATIAIPTTAGTKKEDTTSASRWMGARVRCASATMRTIWPSRVSEPTRSACITKLPVPLIVPAVTL